MSVMYGLRYGCQPRKHPPKATTTPLALRRICGVCRYFTGDGIAAAGHCALFDADVHGRASAERCGDWGRRTAGVDAPAEVRSVRAGVSTGQRDAPGPDAPAPERGLPVAAAKPGPKANHDIERRRASVRGLAFEGKTLREAAAILGVSYETVCNDAKAAGVSFPRTSEKLRRPKTVQRNPALRDELVARIAAGGALGSVREIAARHKVKIDTVYAMASRIRREVQR